MSSLLWFWHGDDNIQLPNLATGGEISILYLLNLPSHSFPLPLSPVHSLSPCLPLVEAKF
jgi:hypothetical protein